MVCTPIAIVYVVGMLPDIESQQGHIAHRHRISAIRALYDNQFAFLVLCQPSPTRTE